MRRGIIVVGHAYPSEDAQRAQIGDVDEFRAMSPMTAEDRRAQWAAACADLQAGDTVCVAELAFLADDLAGMCHAVGALADAGVHLEVGGEDATTAGIVAGVCALRHAHGRAQRIRVTEMMAVAAARRSATPPKCLFVPADLADACSHA